jgi:hypothetical protein
MKLCTRFSYKKTVAKERNYLQTPFPANIPRTFLALPCCLHSLLVPIHIVGEEEITKQGAILQAGAKELEVSCLPADLPDSVTVDVSQLQIGEKVTVADLVVGANVEKISDPDTVVAVILGASKSTDDETTEEEEATGESEAAE